MRRTCTYAHEHPSHVSSNKTATHMVIVVERRVAATNAVIDAEGDALVSGRDENDNAITCCSHDHPFHPPDLVTPIARRRVHEMQVTLDSTSLKC